MTGWFRLFSLIPMHAILFECESCAVCMLHSIDATRTSNEYQQQQPSYINIHLSIYTRMYDCICNTLHSFSDYSSIEFNGFSWKLIHWIEKKTNLISTTRYFQWIFINRIVFFLLPFISLDSIGISDWNHVDWSANSNKIEYLMPIRDWTIK